MDENREWAPEDHIIIDPGPPYGPRPPAEPEQERQRKRADRAPEDDVVDAPRPD